MSDKFLHFIVSYILTCLILFVLIPIIPKLKHRAPRFWHSESQVRNTIVALVFVFSCAAAVFVGVAKEFIDSLGFGNLEFLDFLADLAGVWMAVFSMMGQMSKRGNVKKSVAFRSNRNAPPPKQDFVIPPPKWDDPPSK